MNRTLVKPTCGEALQSLWVAVTSEELEAARLLCALAGLSEIQSITENGHTTTQTVEDILSIKRAAYERVEQEERARKDRRAAYMRERYHRLKHQGSAVTA